MATDLVVLQAGKNLHAHGPIAALFRSRCARSGARAHVALRVENVQLVEAGRAAEELDQPCGQARRAVLCCALDARQVGDVGFDCPREPRAAANRVES